MKATISFIFKILSGLVLLMVLLTIGMSAHAEEQGPRERKTVRIVGGVEAEVGQWPWMAALVESYTDDLESGHFCGGALIHPRWVVTAGHCVTISQDQPEDIEVVLGAHDLSASHEEGRVRLPVKQILLHPNYDHAIMDSDIALLELYDPVEGRPLLDIFPGDRQLVVFDNGTEIGETATVMGWGRTSDTGSYSAVLMQVSLPIVSMTTCSQAYHDYDSNLYPLDEFTDNMRCAGPESGGKDSCEGDSGGPLVVEKSTDKWELAGIVSWGDKCAEPGLYGVYTRVENFLGWIHGYVPIRGDWNENGRLDMVDALGMLRATAGLAEYRSAGDYNNNQKADLEDTMAILAVLVGI